METIGSTVLLGGASGRFAGMVLPELVARGARVRALVRNQEQAASAYRRGASEVVYADLRDMDSLAKAVDGVEGVFHIGPAFVADEAQLGINMVHAASQAGVRRFVFSSVIQPTNTALANHASKIPVENALYSSGMAYTILHPTNFFQNIRPGWKKVINDSLFAEPFPATVRIGRVDYRDVAEVAAIALTSDKLAYGSFELCDEAALSREDIAAVMSDVLERPVAPAAPEFDEWAAMVGLTNDRQYRQSLAAVHRHYADHGAPANTRVLRAILGREPRSLRRYLEELAAELPARHEA